MSRQAKIGRLRIRVPAGQAAAPKSLAADVARHLAGSVGDWKAEKVDSVRTKVSGGGSSGDSLARSIARSISNSLSNRGGSS